MFPPGWINRIQDAGAGLGLERVSFCPSSIRLRCYNALAVQNGNTASFLTTAGSTNDKLLPVYSCPSDASDEQGGRGPSTVWTLGYGGYKKVELPRRQRV